MISLKEEKNEFWEWAKAFLIAIVLAVVVRHFIFSPVIVDGKSMMPTLHDRDRMIVDKVNYTLLEPKRFDIIVFRASKSENYVKRVIGLPGDTIEYKDDILYINGKAFKEPYLDEYKKQNVLGAPLTNSFSLKDTPIGRKTVPEGHLFVMGDNRRHSTDSRHIGAIPMKDVLGSAKMIYWPFNDVHMVK